MTKNTFCRCDEMISIYHINVCCIANVVTAKTQVSGKQHVCNEAIKSTCLQLYYYLSSLYYIICHPFIASSVMPLLHSYNL